MIVKKVVTGSLDGKPAIWAEAENGEIAAFAYFVDEDAYMDFLACLEAGYLMPKSKGPYTPPEVKT